MNLVFDVEANGLLKDVSSIHCVCIYDIDNDQTSIFNDVGTGEPITRAVTMLEEAEHVVGHNIINYDLPALKKCYPFFDFKGQAVDTLILSHVYHANLLDIDKKRKWLDMPAKLYGSHSLKAYGYRLGEHKAEIETAWDSWSQEMEDYMAQDVVVTRKLWKHFLPYLTGSKWSTK
jgi:hypothetical protein